MFWFRIEKTASLFNILALSSVFKVIFVLATSGYLLFFLGFPALTIFFQSSSELFPMLQLLLFCVHWIFKPRVTDLFDKRLNKRYTFYTWMEPEIIKPKHTWKVRKVAPAYNSSKHCNLCLYEKNAYDHLDKTPLKQSELISKCRHENKFLLCHLDTSKTNHNN